MQRSNKAWSAFISQTSRGNHLLRMFVLRRNADMTAKDAARAFGDIERGCVTVFCKRWDILLPRTKAGRRYYARCRRLRIIPRVQRTKPRKY